MLGESHEQIAKPYQLNFLPDEIANFIKGVLKDRFNLLSPDEFLILVTAYQEKSVNNVRVQELTNKYSKDINKLLSNLVEEGLLLPQGTGRGTIYILSDVFIEIDENRLSSNKEEVYNNNESLGNSGDYLGNSDMSLGNNEDHRNLMEISRPARVKRRLQPEILRTLILSLCANQFLTITKLSYYLNRNPDGLRKNHIKKLVEMNNLELRYPNTPNHKQQAYKTVKEEHSRPV